jgi:hypothetical protein
MRPRGQEGSNALAVSVGGATRGCPLTPSSPEVPRPPEALENRLPGGGGRPGEDG